MAKQIKRWTAEEDVILSEAVDKNPKHPQEEFVDVANKLGRTLASVKGRYKRLFLDTGKMQKLVVGRPRKTEKKTVEEVKKESAFRRFFRRVFHI